MDTLEKAAREYARIPLHKDINDERYYNGHAVENYDPFMGSGTTALSTLDLNRKWIGSEISEKYCEIIKSRLGDAIAENPLW